VYTHVDQPTYRTLSNLHGMVVIVLMVDIKYRLQMCNTKSVRYKSWRIASLIFTASKPNIK